MLLCATSPEPDIWLHLKFIFHFPVPSSPMYHVFLPQPPTFPSFDLSQSPFKRPAPYQFPSPLFAWLSQCPLPMLSITHAHASLGKSHLILVEETKKIVQRYIWTFFFNRKKRALNSKLFPYKEAGRRGREEAMVVSNPHRLGHWWWQEALLIPSGQDPLARGIQSKQVGVGSGREADRDVQRWRERNIHKIKGWWGKGKGQTQERKVGVGMGNGARNKVQGKRGRVKEEGWRKKQKQIRREKTEAVGGRDASPDGSWRAKGTEWDGRSKGEKGRERERLPCLAAVYRLTSLHCHQ